MQINNTENPVLIIGGPTASGKSDLALLYAKEYNGVIINADSLQLFDKLKTLSAHPSKEEQEQAPHKLYGVLSVESSISAPEWAKMAVTEINKAHDNNQLPIIVGGTGFYIKALTEGLSPIPDIPNEIRTAVNNLHDKIGTEGILKELQDVSDPIIDYIDVKNGQRVKRALEVLRTTGKSLKHWQDIPKNPPGDNLSSFKMALIPDREILYDRCNSRFQKMIDLGVMKEVKELDEMIKQDLVPDDATILKSLGFKQLQSYLHGELEKSDAIDQATQITRNYAKRQITWCRNQLKPDIILSESKLIDVFCS